MDNRVMRNLRLRFIKMVKQVVGKMLHQAVPLMKAEVPSMRSL